MKRKLCLLLIGTLVWACFTDIGSSVSGVAAVENGVMTVRFEDAALEKNVEAGMLVTVGGTASPIVSVGVGADGRAFAQAETALADGTDGVIFAHEDLTINGSGSLTVTGGWKHGISANDDLVITGGTITVEAATDAIRANDSLRIKDADITVTAGDDGITTASTPTRPSTSLAAPS